MTIYTNKTISFAENLINTYGKYDSLSQAYVLDIHQVPSFCLEELAAYLMSENDSYASEATGYDNPLYLSKMLPALQRYLSHSTDRDEEIEFLNIWKKGVTEYFYPDMQTILDDLCNEKTFNYKQYKYFESSASFAMR